MKLNIKIHPKIKTGIQPILDKLPQGKIQRWIILGGMALLLVILIMAFVPKSLNIATAEVVKGEFIIDLNLRGEVDALKSTNVSVPRMRRRMLLQIIDMAEEGTIVKKGDFLIQMDTSDAEQKVEEAGDKLANANAQLESEKATISSNMAQLHSQLEREKYNYEQAKLSLKMMQFEAEAKKQEYELNMKKAEVALAQAEEKIASQKIIDRATRKKAELEVRQAELELKEAEQALDKLTLKAPIDGLVVYKEIWKGGNMEKVQVGDTPWPGMPVIGIPDLSVMQAKVTVNEVDISKIEKGQNAIITVDALEGQSYYGKISRVASLARREEATNMKVFDVEVTIDSTDGRLRPGMTCDCLIITGRITDALSIPLQAVFQDEDKTIVYKAGSRAPRMQEVVVGDKSSNYIIVQEGLEEGDRVCLRDPTVPLEEIGTESESVSTSRNKPKRSSRSGRMIMIH
jgi:RND family efflux transporter MFP subunit